MSTRYILVGGLDYAAADGGKALCQAFVRGLAGPARILSCCFAEPRETWEEKFERKAKGFLMRNLGNDIHVELAFPDTFAEQVARSDVIYLHGGDQALLGLYLDRFDFKQLCTGKTIVGSSAGAQYLAAQSWSCDWRSVQAGSGILPVCVIPHYGADFSDTIPGPIDWEKAKTDLEAVSEGLPIHCLREGEFIELTV
jgi:hypothetical protein